MPAPPWASESVAHLPACVPLPDAARETGLSISTLRRMAADGRLRLLRTAPGSGGGGRTLVARADLAALLARLAGEGA